MKLLLGIVAGVVGMWVYRSEQVRQRAQQGLSAAPEPLQKARQTVATAASSSAQRAAGVIDAAPLPEAVKQAAARATAGTGARAPGSATVTNAPGYIGTPGVEAASGRDRTGPGGDLPPDLAQP
jgi:hypothetical protein